MPMPPLTPIHVGVTAPPTVKAAEVKVPDQVISGGQTFKLTGNPAHPYVAIPQGFTDAQWDEIQALNPGVTLLRIVSPVVQPQTTALAVPMADVSHEALSAWTDIVGGLLGVGASILVPGPWLPVVQTILHTGIPFMKNLLGGQVKERWTLAQILLEAATPSAIPQT